MPRKRFQPSPSNVERDPETHSVEDEPAATHWLPAAVAVLVTSRFFLPAESAAQGETLWIVLFWLLAGVVWLFGLSRNQSPLPRLGWLGAGIALLVGGHVLSAIGILLTEGDKRAALNMLWEWVGVGASAMLICAVMQTREGRGKLLAMTLVSGVVLAGFGVWQHFVWYPQISAQLSELGELQSAPPDDDPAAMRTRLERIERLQREMGWTAATEGTSQPMFRDRVQASTEPIGRFALANTFAGLLLVAIFVGLGSLQQARRRRVNMLSVSGLIAGLLLITYCLWLTKSRTALIGTIGGLVVFGIAARRARTERSRSPFVWAGIVVVLIGIPIVAALSGSLDRQVVSEAPKSLLYRLEYWQATAGLIGDHWLLGVGPGNFRQHYLPYKLPGSSEEILDPHNLFLDVWANGGLLALAGLILVLVIALRRRSSVAAETSLEDEAPHSPAVWRAIRLGVLGTAALAMAALSEMLGGTMGSGQWVALVLGWWVAAFALSMGLAVVMGETMAFAALVGLVIHLSGAGGIAMPAISQLFLILLFAVTAREEPSTAEPPTPVDDRKSRLVGKLSLTVGIALVIACAVTAALPVTKARAAMSIGRSLWLGDRQPLAAEKHFQQAAEDDPLFPEPWQELAGLRFSRWMQTSDDSDFQKAVAAQQESIARDPRNAGRWRMLGQLWTHRYDRDGGADAAEAAFSALSQAVERYPQLAIAQAELAIAAQRAGKRDHSQAAADVALRLDQMNRQRGHVDKYLTQEQLAELRAISGSDPSRGEK